MRRLLNGTVQSRMETAQARLLKKLRAQGFLHIWPCDRCGGVVTREDLVVYRDGRAKRQVVRRCWPLDESRARAWCGEPPWMPSVPVPCSTGLPVGTAQAIQDCDQPHHRRDLVAAVHSPAAAESLEKTKEEITMGTIRCIRCNKKAPGSSRKRYCEGCRRTVAAQQKADHVRRKNEAAGLVSPDGKCMCGCSRAVKPGNRYASSGCAGRAARERLKAQVAAEAAASVPEVAPPKPAPGPAPEARVSLVDLVQRLLEVSQEEQAAVIEMVRLERARRCA